MAAIERFEDIKAWQVARELTKHVYELSSQGAFARDYGLRDQMQRAAVSIMANVVHPVEYYDRRSLLHGSGPVE